MGRGNPTRNTGSVKSASNGDDSRADRMMKVSTNGKKIMFIVIRLLVDFLLCFFSVQDVSKTVIAN